ncbi:MAG: hypothetical protein ABEJ84_02985 [Halodesulfurarchaeum sp.]
MDRSELHVEADVAYSDHVAVSLGQPSTWITGWYREKGPSL